MGQKVDPRIIRIGVAGNEAHAKWCASKQHYAKFLNDDIKIRKFLKLKLSPAGLAHMLFERPAEHVLIVTAYCARPGVVIGKAGSDIADLKRYVKQRFGVQCHINIVEVKKTELIASLVAQNIATQLEKRIAFRKAMKRAVQSAMRAGALGIKVCASGRLAGAEIARSEGYREGRVPLHTFRADIDYATASAHTTYGVIGVKVWIYKGDRFVEKLNTQKEK